MGSISITDGGIVSSGRFVVGENSGSNGTATVSGSGSIWTNTAGCDVGLDGNATLNITSGGQVSDLRRYVQSERMVTGTVTWMVSAPL